MRCLRLRRISTMRYRRFWAVFTRWARKSMMYSDSARCLEILHDPVMSRAAGAGTVSAGKWIATLAGQSCAAYTDIAAVAASETAMTAVAASETAMAAVVSNATALNAVVTSQVALNAVAASETAMAAVIGNVTALNAVVTFSGCNERGSCKRNCYDGGYCEQYSAQCGGDFSCSDERGSFVLCGCGRSLRERGCG